MGKRNWGCNGFTCNPPHILIRRGGRLNLFVTVCTPSFSELSPALRCKILRSMLYGLSKPTLRTLMLTSLASGNPLVSYKSWDKYRNRVVLGRANCEWGFRPFQSSSQISTVVFRRLFGFTPHSIQDFLGAIHILRQYIFFSFWTAFSLLCK